MRKLLIAALALVALAAVATVALAANRYKVTPATSSTTAKGSLNRPIAVKFRFGFEVTDTEDLRPFVIDQYRIAGEGLHAYPDARPTCTYDQATDPNVTDPDDISAACKRALVGSGAIENAFGAPNDRTQKGDCDVQLTLYNIRTGDKRAGFRSTHRQIRRNGGLAIRVDTYLPEGSRCPIPVHEALAAPFYDTKIQGIPTTELRFRVPSTLKHPSGLDNSLIDVVSTIRRKLGRAEVAGGNERRVGYWSAVGRKGATRTVRVTFIDESGDKQTATAQD